jgi:cytochrome P450
MGLSVVILSLTTILWALYHFLVHPLFLSPLAKIPNAHFTSGFLPLWIWWKRRAGYETRSILAAHQRYGPIVRLAPHEVSVATLDGLRRIYGGGFDRHNSYLRFINYDTPTLFTMIPFDAHSARKRMMTHVFSKSYLQASPDVDGLSRELVLRRLLPVLQSAAAAAEPVDVVHMFFAACHDFMAAFEFGLRRSTDLIRDPEYSAHYIAISWVKLRDEPGNVQAAKEREEHCMAICRSIEEDASRNDKTTPSSPTESTVNSEPDTKPVLYAQLSAGLTKAGLSSEARLIELASEMLDSMDAAREAIGIALVYLAYELSRAPHLQLSLRKELLTLSPNITLDSTLNKLPTPREIDSLPLLQAIVQESLRLHTPTAAPQARVVPPGGTVVEGYEIPAGVRISTAARVLHLNEEVFPDPLSFVPERWMPMQEKESGYGDIVEMRRWFWAFSNGGKMCIGNNFSLQGMCCRSSVPLFRSSRLSVTTGIIEISFVSINFTEVIIQ